MGYGVAAVPSELPPILKNPDDGLAVPSRELFVELLDELRGVDERFEQCDNG